MAKQSKDAEWLERRRELVAAVRSGRVTAREVMAELGVSGSVYGGWCRAEQMREAAEGGARSEVPSAARFRRVSLVGPRPRSAVADVLLRGGKRVRVAAGFDAAELVRLVKVLESC